MPVSREKTALLSCSQVLDVASASGEPAVSIARALPGAHMISTDLAEAYLALGQARAEHAGLADCVSFQTADGEDLHSFQNASMDAVTCSLGLMFMPRHDRALAEMHRVLKPGGTLAVAVWYSTAKVSFFRTIMTFCQGEGRRAERKGIHHLTMREC